MCGTLLELLGKVGCLEVLCCVSHNDHKVKLHFNVVLVKLMSSTVSHNK